ncbi:MAG: polyamine aminopropyltransferase [Candidatus Aminicenantes bacterium]|nr:polyamine aminopropyltransferase [Candidatus Aminicenantes bacterium]
MKTIEIREFHTPSSGIFFRAGRRLLSERTPFQKIEVYETDSYGRVLFLDGLVQTTEKDEFFYHEMLVHPAMMAHPRPENVLIIGGGDGGALREVLRYPVKSAVLVEIDGRVIEVCRRWFPGLAKSFEDPRAEITVEDGNRYIRETGRRFDVIAVDSSDPVGPSAILHQRSFFAALKRCLRPGGLIVAQAGSPLFHLDPLRKKRRFLKQLFKRALYYYGPAPTYPGGLWGYAFLSDGLDPLQTRRRRPPKKLKYYNIDVHRAAFAAPEFLKER